MAVLIAGLLTFASVGAAALTVPGVVTVDTSQIPPSVDLSQISPDSDSNSLLPSTTTTTT